MHGAMIDRTESAIEHGAAALFGAAVAYCAGHLPLPGISIGMGAAGFLLCRVALARFGRECPSFAAPNFALRAFGTLDATELLLTEADRLDTPAESQRENVLLLDDVLVTVGPDSRVVRLFDPAAMPTPGEFNRRIDRHLDQGTMELRGPDASQALSDALAELRLGLR